MYVECNIEARSRDHYCRGKAITITHSECVFVVLAIRHGKRMRHITLSSVACPTLPYFATLFHKRHDFWRNVLNIKCVSWFSLKRLSETFLILTRIQQDTVTHVRRSSRYSCQILMKLKPPRHIFQKYLRITLHDNPSTGSRVVPCGRTDMTELIVPFRNFSNAPRSPQNARNFCQVIYIMTQVRLHMLPRCHHCYGKTDESSVTGQNSPYLHNNYEYTPKTIWNFCDHSINWQYTSTRQTISLDARLNVDFFWRQIIRMNISSSNPISPQTLGK
jgi:hypothetical protein